MHIESKSKLFDILTFSGDGHGGPGWLENFVLETQKDGHLFFHSGISNCLSITVVPRYSKPRYNEEPVKTNRI